MLVFVLNIDGFAVDQSTQSLHWKGRPDAVQFGVAVPENYRPGTNVGTVVISVGSVPLGHIKFKVRVVQPEMSSEPDRVPVGAGPTGYTARRYTLAFVSYALEDRSRVIARVQMLRLAGIRWFQDLLSLEPGDRWERKIYEYIDRCDLFLLFWSAAASRSTWVLNEISYAVSRKGGDDDAPPTIFPVILDGPPIVPPPNELAHLHFDDPLTRFLSLPEQKRKKSRAQGRNKASGLR